MSKHERWETVEFDCPCCGEKGVITDINKIKGGGVVAVCGHCSPCSLSFAVEIKNDAVEVIPPPYEEDVNAPFDLEGMEASPVLQ